MTIIVTGGDGYLGWPTALRIALGGDERVVIADNGFRRQWVRDVGSVSATSISPLEDRVACASKLSAVDVDLRDRDGVDELLRVHEPSAIVHLAAQPSAPYSQIDGRRADFTQANNARMARNLLWGLYENDLTDCHFIETTTTGLYGTPDFTIPEGETLLTDAHGDSTESDRLPFPNLGGSWYHAGKGIDSANIRLAVDQFGIMATEVRTSIVVGIETVTTYQVGQDTRFDFDYYFGTVAHRFCAQAVAGYPLTVYGEGEQRKPFITLTDAVEGLYQLTVADRWPSDHAVVNQVARPISIVELAETVANAARGHGFDTEVVHVENPRDEDEHHEMRIDNDQYRAVLGHDFERVFDAIDTVIGRLAAIEDRHATISTHTDRFLPAALLEDE